MAFTNIGAAVLQASSAASFRVASNFSTLLSNPHFSAFSLTLMASGGNGNLIMSFFKNPPNDFSLDIYLMVVAIQNHYKIIEYPVRWDERVAGEAKGGGSIKAKLRLIIQTLKCIIALKKKFKTS